MHGSRDSSVCAKARKAFAAGVLAAGLMLVSGAAAAEEPVERNAAMAEKSPAEDPPAQESAARLQADSKPPPKASLGLSLGTGFDAIRAEPRIFATASGTVPLPLRMEAFASLGVASEAGGAKIEESTLELSHRTGLLTIAGGMYTSAHLWTDKLSPYGTMALKLPKGFSVSGDYVYLVGLEHPHLVLLKAGKDVLDGKMSFFVKGGWTIPDGWSARAGISLAAVKDFPVITLDSVVMGDGKRVTFSDTILSANWKW